MKDWFANGSIEGFNQLHSGFNRLKANLSPDYLSAELKFLNELIQQIPLEGSKEIYRKQLINVLDSLPQSREVGLAKLVNSQDKVTIEVSGEKIKGKVLQMQSTYWFVYGNGVTNSYLLSPDRCSIQDGILKVSGSPFIISSTDPDYNRVQEALKSSS